MMIRLVGAIISCIVSMAVFADTAILHSSTPLEKGDIRGQLSPQQFTILASELNAKINQVYLKEGDRFQANQLLVELDCRLQQAQLERAKATLIAAEQTYQANQRLLALNSVGQLELEMASAEVAKSKADVSLIETTLQKCQISAPFSGRVADQLAQSQQYVQAGQPILEILDDSTLELAFIVPSYWLTWLKVGCEFHVAIDETAKIYPAKIARLGARVDPVSQSIKVTAKIDGQFPELIAGMSGRIQLIPEKISSNTLAGSAA